MNIPECPWRPESCLTTDFVQPAGIAISRQAAKLRASTANDDEFIRAVAGHIRDAYFYPNDWRGEPSAGMLFARHDKTPCKWFFRKKLDYAWSYPAEVMAAGAGICIDTANLCTSLLLAGGVPSTVALGAVVNSVTGQISGYHAWTEVIHRGIPSIIETTIHTPNAELLVTTGSVYNRHSDWAKSNGIYYALEARYDNSRYEGVGSLGASMVQLLGLPAGRVQCYGMAHTLDRLARRKSAILREWKKSETLTHKILARVYGGA